MTRGVSGYVTPCTFHRGGETMAALPWSGGGANVGVNGRRYASAECRISFTNRIPSGVSEPELARVSIASQVCARQ